MHHIISWKSKKKLAFHEFSRLFKGNFKGVAWKYFWVTCIFYFCWANIMHRWSSRHFSINPVTEQVLYIAQWSIFPKQHFMFSYELMINIMVDFLNYNTFFSKSPEFITFYLRPKSTHRLKWRGVMFSKMQFLLKSTKVDLVFLGYIYTFFFFLLLLTTLLETPILQETYRIFYIKCIFFHSPPHHRAAPSHCCRDDCPSGGCRSRRWPPRRHRCRPRPMPSGWLFHCHHSHCHRPPPAGPFPATAASSPSWPSWPVMICYLRNAKLRKNIDKTC